MTRVIIVDKLTSRQVNKLIAAINYSRQVDE